MKNHRWMLILALIALCVPAVAAGLAPETSLSVYVEQEGFVDTNGVMLYYMMVGRGEPLVVMHGGPGASHDYFLPYLLPLARHNRVIFIDERGSGKSQKLEDPPATPLKTWWRTSRPSGRR